MVDDAFLYTLGILVIAGALMALVARAIRMPSIIAYLLAGLAVGPFAGFVHAPELVGDISEAGIVLLLFLIGLEMSVGKIRDIGVVALKAGSAQIVLTFALAFGAVALLPLPWSDVAMVAAALVFSSTVVAIKLLEEKREMDQPHGRIALGVLLIQDVAVILLLTVISALGGPEEGDGESGARQVVTALLAAFAGVVATVAIVAAAAKWVLPRAFAWASRSPETLFIWSLCWCFGVVLLAHTFHLSPEIGAFLAGVALAQLPYSHDLRRRVHPMMNFFLAVFFVSLGVGIDPAAVASQWPAVLLLVAFVILVKPLVIALVVGRLGFGAHTAALGGIALGQVSEFSLILAALALGGGLVTQDALSLIGAVALVSFALSAFAITASDTVIAFLEKSRLLRILRTSARVHSHRPDPPRHQARSNHIIVVGMNTLGRRIAGDASRRGWDVLAVDTDPRKLRGLPCDTLHGSASELPVLAEIDLDNARLLVSALRIDEANDWLAFQCRQRGIPCAINVVDLSDIELLLEMDPAYLIAAKVDGIKHQTQELRRLGILEPAPTPQQP